MPGSETRPLAGVQRSFGVLEGHQGYKVSLRSVYKERGQSQPRIKFGHGVEFLYGKILDTQTAASMLPRKNLPLRIVALLPFCAAVDIIRCGTQDPGRTLVDIVRSFAGNKKCIKAAPYYRPPKIAVDTYIHVVVSSEDRKEEPPESKLKEQMDVLNQGYAPTGMQYRLRGIDRTVNATWSNGDDQAKMKKRLRKGDYKTLNLYYLERLTAPGLRPRAILLGHCTFPSTVTEKSADFFDDGCRMLISTLPGGVIPATAKVNFDGKITVHEVGHWNGLFHTFMGGCDETLGGDLICDTPAETQVDNRPEPKQQAGAEELGMSRGQEHLSKHDGAERCGRGCHSQLHELL
ncbi:metalloprotease MEP1 [Ophiocordyceps sinensis CO18]|uniref:Metalloprotease MEP1 n=1 Tax=Ophiocordyceps sinensis (strain Co18 / CGMCC 3.14243) TaxID=911162 RepID=T5AEH1_OPHSC|nr:metalloprotease MEP1 [Ophiocordyceps sinensis CO18]